MYPHFIEVHDLKFYYPILVNIDCINKIYLDGNDDMTDTWTLIIMEHGNLSVLETYEEVKKLIENAGALINKGDPRISTQYQLTMQDLRGMVGEPVWSSNTNTWLLVYDGDWAYAPDPDRVCVRVVNRYGCKDIWLSEEDLIAKPLYRMKAG